MSIMVFKIDNQVAFGGYAEMLASGFDGIKMNESSLPPLWGQPAWEVESDSLSVDLTKLKLLAHDKRRKQRELLLKPIDTQILYKIGNSSIVEKLESERVKIRQLDAEIQLDIDASNSEESIYEIIENYTK